LEGDNKMKYEEMKEPNNYLNDNKNLSYVEIARKGFELINLIRDWNKENDFETWDEISYERKLILIENVKAVEENPNLTSKEEHNKWMNARLACGWKYAPVTNRSKKEHSCLVPYKELNFYQKLKDKLWLELVKNLLEEYK